MEKSLKIGLQLVALLIVGSVLAFAPSDVRVDRDYAHFQEAYREGDYRHMAVYLAEIARRQPWQVDLWERAGFFAQRGQDADLAIAYFERAQTLDVLSLKGQVTLGTLYERRGDTNLAEEVWSAAEPSPQAAKYLANLHRDRGDFPAAVEAWQRYLALQGEVSPEVYFELGSLLAAVEPARALTYLEQASGAIPRAEKLLEALGDVRDEEPAYQQVVAGQGLASLDEWRLAEFAFRRALELRPDYAQAWAYWGEALQHVPNAEGDPLDALQKALELDPASSMVNIFLGTYWQREDDHRKALEYYQAAERLSPDNPDIYVEQGRSLGVLGELEEALAMYEKAVELQPQSPVYDQLLARFCINYHYKVREKGLPAARQAVQEAAASPASLWIMGEVMYALDDLQNARKFFHRALNKDPAYPQAHLSLGITYLALDEQEQAVQHLQAVLESAADPALKEQAQRMLSSTTP